MEKSSQIYAEKIIVDRIQPADHPALRRHHKQQHSVMIKPINRSFLNFLTNLVFSQGIGILFPGKI